MKRRVTLLLVLLFVMGLFFMPAISGAGNQDGNSQGENNNSQGGSNNTAWNIPEPLTLFLLGFGVVGLAVIKKKIK